MLNEKKKGTRRIDKIEGFLSDSTELYYELLGLTGKISSRLCFFQIISIIIASLVFSFSSLHLGYQKEAYKSELNEFLSYDNKEFFWEESQDGLIGSPYELSLNSLIF